MGILTPPVIRVPPTIAPQPVDQRFIAVRGWMDCRSTERDGRTGVEFSWDGEDDGEQVSGRGWTAVVDDVTLQGHLFIHLGDDSGFRAEPCARADQQDGR